MGSGPEHFINRGIEENLRAQGHEVTAACIEASDSFRAEIKTAFELYRMLSKQVRTTREQGRFPLVLSGNCNASLGTLGGLNQLRLGVIWFDGHGDFNTPETTASGFLDGMALATVAGLCWRNLVGSIQGFQAISSANILHIGGRDFDPEEKRLLDDSGVTVVEAEAIKRIGMIAALKPAIETLSRYVDSVYIHIDLDVLDPEETPANGYAPPGGLEVNHVEEAIEIVSSRFRIAAAGIAAYDPNYDKQDRTLSAGITLIQKILAGC